MRETDKSEVLNTIRMAICLESNRRAQSNLRHLGELRVPFGKYMGMELQDVPLSYLDRTVSQMPTCWFVRRVIQLIDLLDSEIGINPIEDPGPWRVIKETGGAHDGNS